LIFRKMAAIWKKVFLPKIILNKCQLQKNFQYFGKILCSFLKNVQKKILLKFQVNRLKNLKVILHATLKMRVSRKTRLKFFSPMFWLWDQNVLIYLQSTMPHKAILPWVHWCHQVLFLMTWVLIFWFPLPAPR